MAATATVVMAVAVLAIVPGVAIFEPIFGPVFEPIADGLGVDSSWSPEEGDPDDPLLQVSAEFVTLEVTDTTVRYTVSVENADPESTYTVTLTNRFTDRQQTFSGDSYSSMEEGLKKGVEYTLSVRDGGDVLASETFTTERQMDTYFYLVEEETECTCPEDGMFHFTVDIKDGDGTWTGFTATLSDLYGNSSEVAFDGSGSYTIAVTDAGLMGDVGVLRITCTEVTEDGNVTVTLLNKQFDI